MPAWKATNWDHDWSDFEPCHDLWKLKKCKISRKMKKEIGKSESVTDFVSRKNSQICFRNCQMSPKRGWMIWQYEIVSIVRELLLQRRKRKKEWKKTREINHNFVQRLNQFEEFNLCCLCRLVKQVVLLRQTFITTTKREF